MFNMWDDVLQAQDHDQHTKRCFTGSRPCLLCQKKLLQGRDHCSTCRQTMFYRVKTMFNMSNHVLQGTRPCLTRRTMFSGYKTMFTMPDHDSQGQDHVSQVKQCFTGYKTMFNMPDHVLQGQDHVSHPRPCLTCQTRFYRVQIVFNMLNNAGTRLGDPRR